jgi:hypothetical protein
LSIRSKLIDGHVLVLTETNAAERIEVIEGFWQENEATTLNLNSSHVLGKPAASQASRVT